MVEESRVKEIIQEAIAESGSIHTAITQAIAKAIRVSGAPDEPGVIAKCISENIQSATQAGGVIDAASQQRLPL